MNYDSPDERDRAGMLRAKKMHDQSMQKYGWYAHYIFDDETTPTGTNVHTHGFEKTWKHPDIQIVVPMPQNVVHGILWTVADHITAGVKYEPGRRYAEILKDYDVMFAWAHENDRRVLRMIIPDKNNHLEKGLIGEPYDKQWEGTEE